MDEQITAAVFVDEKQETVRVEFSNFESQADAIEAANYIIAALGIAKIPSVRTKETIH
tara:strand:+ start:1406 stop:1579 length:174 start_codon:yes stop_codon:yes gene_type:complete